MSLEAHLSELGYIVDYSYGSNSIFPPYQRYCTRLF